MKIVIVEDEPLAGDALEELVLKLRPDYEVLERIESVEEGIEWFDAHDVPDLIFCDIHLSDGRSFEMWREVKIDCPVIFTTAYNQYAIEAFKVNSVDYLLKPIKEEELQKAIEKYENLHKEALSSEMKNLRNLIENSVLDRGYLEVKTRFMVKTGQVIKSISTCEVAYFIAEEGVVLLVNFKGNRFVINYTLDQLEAQLDPQMFFRANRQLVVNIEAVKEVTPYFKGRLHLLLEPAPKGDQIISSGKANAFKEWLDM